MCGYRSLFEYIVHADVRRQNTPSRRDEKISLLFLSLSLEFLHQRGARQGARVHTPVPGGLVTWPRSRRRRLGIIAASHGQGRGTGSKPCTPTLLTRKKKSTKQPDVAHPSGNEEEEKVVVVVVVVVVPNWSLLTIHLHLLILILYFPHINIKHQHQQHRSSLQRFVKSWSLQVALRNPSPWESGQRRNKAFPICSSGSNESKLPMNMENLERNGNDHFLFEIPFPCWRS